MGLSTQIRIGSRAVLDVFYPNPCLLCKQSLNNAELHVCLKCANNLPYVHNSDRTEKMLQQIFWGRVDVEQVYTLFNYQKGNQVQDLLHHLKYKQKLKVGVHFGQVLGSAINDVDDLSMIIPVPLHPKKQRQRGYNQSALIAQGIRQSLQIPVKENYIIRNTYTLSQTKFSKYDRWNNVRQIFTVNKPKKLTNKHVLLVDDVLTTGATLEACANALLQVENCRVSIATLAARI